MAFFSAEVGRPMVVVQSTTGSGDVASSENRASMSVMVDDDGVSGRRYLHEGIIYIVLVV
jgi:hypothetical protein